MNTDNRSIKPNIPNPASSYKLQHNKEDIFTSISWQPVLRNFLAKDCNIKVNFYEYIETEKILVLFINDKVVEVKLDGLDIIGFKHEIWRLLQEKSI